MTRSFTPPDMLSTQEIRTIADVRRDTWTKSFYGMGYGAATGVAGHSILSFLVSREFLPLKMKLNRYTATFTVLLCSSLGSVVAHNLHPVFEVGTIKRLPTSEEDSQLSEYQKNLEQAREEDEKRMKNRILRRKTLKASLEN
mmetsp:Transcript_10340/g.15889  ORF Transcript_10340/g.15889 Transcript_10340/m.15889 type:complete len:142 (+) Transcript_10340:133-558(+)